jgi:hypothetical protein
VNPEDDVELRQRHLGELPELELLHHPAGGEVLLERERDDARDAERLEGVADRGAAGLGREPLAPAFRVDPPPDLGIVRPGAMVGEADAADRLARLPVLGEPGAEAVPLVVVERPLEQLLGAVVVPPARQVLRDARVGRPALQRLEIVPPPAAQPQPGCLELGQL